MNKFLIFLVVYVVIGVFTFVIRFTEIYESESENFMICTLWLPHFIRWYYRKFFKWWIKL